MKFRFHNSIVLFFCSFLIFAQMNLFGQTFSMNPNRSEQTGKPGDYFAANITLINLTSQDVGVKLNKTSSTIPSDWGGSMCTTSNCFGFDASNVEDVLKPNTTNTFTIDITTSETPGSGEVVFTIQSKTNASESYTFTMKVTTLLTGVNEAGATRLLTMSQNYPNPFSASKNGYTTIAFTTPGNAPVALRIFSLLGQEIRTLYSTSHLNGATVVTWDGRDNRGSFVSPGMYIYKLETGSTTLSRRLLYTR